MLKAGFPNLKEGSILVLPLDINSYASIVAFVERINADFERIDVAVLNAGLLNRTYYKSPEGWEETLQVDTISTALLALLLLPKLRAAKSRSLGLANLSSGTHTRVKRASLPSSSENILRTCNANIGTYNGQLQYSISKVFVMCVLRALSALATSQNGEPQVLVTACCPGFCVSDLARPYDAWYERIFVWLFYKIFGRSQEEGSRTLVSAAGLGLEGHGGYWKDDHVCTKVGCLHFDVQKRTWPGFPASGSHANAIFTIRPGDLITSAEGKQLQQKVWSEIVDELKTKIPEVEGLASNNDGRLRL